MQLFVGPYQFGSNQTMPLFSCTLRRNAGGQPLSLLKVLHVSGYLTPDAATQDGCVLAENALKTALAGWGQDVLFKTDGGANTGICLLQKDSITGVAITHGPEFKSTKGPEYVNLRSFEFTAESEERLPDTMNLLMNFTETLAFSGGKPIYKHRTNRTGKAQKQLVTPFDTYRATQSGQIVGYQKYPTVPPPLWPDSLKEAGQITIVAPTRKGAGYEGYAINYSYSFEDIGSKALLGVPAVWKN